MCVHTLHVCLVPVMSEEGISYPGPGIADDCELWCGCSQALSHLSSPSWGSFLFYLSHKILLPSSNRKTEWNMLCVHEVLGSLCLRDPRNRKGLFQHPQHQSRLKMITCYVSSFALMTSGV